MTTSAILGIPYISNQQSQPDVTHNQAISLLQIMLSGGAITIGDNTPPGSPVEGDVYVVGPAPTGLWAGRANTIAGFFLNQWLFIPGNDSSGTPIVMGPDQEGLQIWSKTDDATFIWTDLGVSPGLLTWQVLPTDITQLALLTDTNIVTPQEGDILVFRSGLWENIPRGVNFVNELADLPAAIAGVITLVAGNVYVQTASFSLGTDRIAWSEGSAYSSVDSIAITLDYTDTGDMFTFSDTTARINNIALDAPNGRVYNWTDTGVKIGRFHDITIVSCNKLGLFTGVAGILRFTNHSPASITADGLEFIGNFRSFLWEISATTLDAGAIFNLGTTTFDSFIGDAILATLNGSANLISGATGSANINTGGSGLIRTMRISGPGTPLSGIEVDDALWEFRQNDDIADTRPDGLLSLTANATATVITATSTPVLVLGTWVIERTSQFIGTAAGRLTYKGGKDATIPVTIGITAETVSGLNKDVNFYLYKNGTQIANSKTRALLSQNDVKNQSVLWQLVMSTDDYLELFVENVTDTTNVLVEDAKFRAN